MSGYSETSVEASVVLGAESFVCVVPALLGAARSVCTPAAVSFTHVL